jgi:hypothetical protein
MLRAEYVLGDGPNEAERFSRHGNRCDLSRTSAVNLMIQLEEPVLKSLPAVSNHMCFLVLLPRPESFTGSGSVAIRPCCLDQDVTTVGVDRLRDGPLTASFSGGMLPRYKSEVRHQLLRGLESTQVVEFGGEDRGGLGVDAAGAAQRPTILR